MFKTLRHYLELVRFSHTLFAMPFALASMLWAAQGLPSGKIFALIVLCMVTCRNTAMAFNRLVDAKIDGENPRTMRRHIPAGVLTRASVIGFLVANGAAFIVATYFINSLAFYLSVPTLLAVCGYSLTKRFTSFSHLALGFAIGISPVGAWIAVRGGFSLEPILLCVALAFWIAGFDIIYATQDQEFDRARGLNSLVVRLGVPGALKAALVFHALTWLVLVGLGWMGGMGAAYHICMVLVGGLLIYLHGFRRSASLDALNQDFFLANIAISLCVLAGIGAHFL